MRQALVSAAVGCVLLVGASSARAQDDVNGVMLQAWYWDSPPRTPWTQGTNEQWWTRSRA